MPRTSPRILAVAIIGVTAPACVVEDAVDEGVSVQEIAGGTVTPPGMFPAVGKAESCSGTLISDRVVLTAGHCVCDFFDPVFGCVLSTTSFALEGVDDFTTPEDETLDPAGVSFSGSPIVHPDYEAGGGSESIIDNDYAILVLDENVSSRVSVTPMSISTSAPVVLPFPFPSTVMTFVGFGADSHPDCAVEEGVKRHASTALDAIYDHGKYGLDLYFQDGNVHGCSGDSGAPAIDSAGRIAGVLSTGDSDSYTYFDGTYKAREWIQQQLTSPGNRVQIRSFESSPAQARYFDASGDMSMFGWNDLEDLRLAGDFLGLGHEQVLYINRGAGVGRFQIVNHTWEFSPAESLFLAGYSVSGAYGEFLDSTADRQIVGDFLGLGHDQVMFINTGGSGGRIAIADFAVGVAPAYFESYTQSVLLNGWHDGSGTTRDQILVGDFRANGHDQVMFINRGTGAGRVLIVDFGPGHPPPAQWGADVPYYEAYSQSTTLNGWHDGNNDFQVAGDFMGQGFDQVLFANGDGFGGRMMIVDFRGAAPTDWPSDIWYYEGYGWSTMFNFWQDADDVLLAGDFTGEGFDQLLLVNRGPVGRFLVADFRGGYPADQRFIQFQGQDLTLETRIDSDDGLLIGDFRSLERSQLLTIERF